MRPVPAIPMPLSLSDAASALQNAASGCHNLQTACAKRFGACASYALSSGRAALWLALNALYDVHPDRRRVIIPAFTCPTVGRAVMATGLESVCADISSRTYNIDPAAVEPLLTDDTLAIVAPHMFGVPCDIPALRTLCDARGIALIEDLALCFGGAVAGQQIGTRGDIGFASLGRSKNLRGYEGGLLWVQNPRLQAAVDARRNNLPAASRSFTAFPKQVAISLFSSPHAWNLLRRSPLLRVGNEDQSFDAYPSRLTGWMAALADISLQRVDRFNAVRAEPARVLRDALDGADTLSLQEPLPESTCTFPRVATRVQPAVRDQLVASLQAEGIDARAFYTRVMYEYDWWQRAADQPECPAARALLAANLVLPLHYTMTADHALEMAAIVRRVVADAHS